HLGNLPSVGLNCAACHVAEITALGSGVQVRVLGVTGHFDAEAYFGSVVVATFRTSDPVNMKKFLKAYLGYVWKDVRLGILDTEWARQEPRILEAISAD